MWSVHSSGSQSELQAHTRGKHCERLSCDICGKTFQNKSILNVHIRNKHSGLLRQCDQCEFSMFGQKGVLKRHKSMMHKATRFICQFCTFTAETDNDVKSHKEEVHPEKQTYQVDSIKSNERRRKEKESLIDYSCKECGHKAKVRQSLQAHMKAVHLGVKFKCVEEGCEYAASQKQALKNHVNSKHKKIKFSCDECECTKSSQQQIKTHKTLKHGVPVLACNNCKFRSRSMDKLKKHMFNMHN